MNDCEVRKAMYIYFLGDNMNYYGDHVYSFRTRIIADQFRCVIVRLFHANQHLHWQDGCCVRIHMD